MGQGFLGLLGEEGDQPPLGARQIFGGTGTLQAEPYPALLDRVDEGRVDIGFAADRGRVAERVRHRLEHRLEADALFARGADPLEGDRARAPGAEMLGGEILAGGFADIIVDVGRADRLCLPLLVDELEEVLARRSWQRRTIRERVLSVIESSRSIPLLALKRILTVRPATLAWRLRKVVAP